MICVDQPRESIPGRVSISRLFCSSRDSGHKSMGNPGIPGYFRFSRKPVFFVEVSVEFHQCNVFKIKYKEKKIFQDQKLITIYCILYVI